MFFSYLKAGDADTNGAVAGALLGCKLGVDKIPRSWIGKLCHKKWLDDIIKKWVNFFFTLYYCQILLVTFIGCLII